MNMNNYVRIREIAVHHAEKVVGNDVYLKHFEESGKDVRKLFEEVYGRDKRYVSDPDKGENTLSMMIEVAKQVLEKSSLQGSDIDLIIAGTQIPEYVVPASAVMIHHAIGAKRDAYAYDVNANCGSMLVALENAYHYMETCDKYNRILIVGGECASGVHRPDNELGNGVFGDATCALILERSDEPAGYLDSEFFTNNIYFDKMLFPKCGISNLRKADKQDMLAEFQKVDCNIELVIERLRSILDRNNLVVEDIGAYCFSQLLLKNVQILREEFNIPEEKSIYIGDTYGYTGSTSIFIALYEAINRKTIKRGDYVLLWTVGAGMQHFFLLLKY